MSSALLAKMLYVTGVLNLSVSMLLGNESAEYFNLVEDCSICCECLDYKEAEVQTVTLPCYHVFHAACMSAWQKQCEEHRRRAGCPLCRSPVCV